MDNPTVAAAVVAGIVALATAIISSPLRYWVDKLLLNHKLRAEFENQQRSDLRRLISRYVGQMIEASEALNHRIWNLYKNAPKGWLDLEGEYKKAGRKHYFKTSIFRFLTVFALARRFEGESLLLDPRIAEKTDLIYLKYIKMLRWSITSVQLFDGIPYDDAKATDHFFTEQIRLVADSFWREKGLVSLEDFDEYIEKESRIVSVLQFFDGLSPIESRLRWDRIVALHLVLMAFMNCFGYDMQRSSSSQFIEVAEKIRHGEVRLNLVKWMRKHGLQNSPGFREIELAVNNIELC